MEDTAGRPPADFDVQEFDDLMLPADHRWLYLFVVLAA